MIFYRNVYYVGQDNHIDDCSPLIAEFPLNILKKLVLTITQLQSFIDMKLQHVYRGQDKVLHTLMVILHFFISEVWHFLVLCLFCVVFIYAHPIIR